MQCSAVLRFIVEFEISQWSFNCHVMLNRATCKDYYNHLPLMAAINQLLTNMCRHRSKCIRVYPALETIDFSPYMVTALLRYQLVLVGEGRGSAIPLIPSFSLLLNVTMRYLQLVETCILCGSGQSSCSTKVTWGTPLAHSVCLRDDWARFWLGRSSRRYLGTQLIGSVSSTMHTQLTAQPLHASEKECKLLKSISCLLF